MTKSIYSLFAYELSQQHHLPNILPPTVEIDLTNSCNQDCIYCCSADYRSKNSSKAKFDHFSKLIDELANWSPRGKHVGGLTSIIFVGGGEPSLFKGYEKLIKQCIDHGFLTSMITNGTHLDKLLEIGDDYIKRISWIGVDIDSGNEMLFNKIRLPKTENQYNKVKENIKLITAAGGTVDIKALIMPETSTAENIDELIAYTLDVNARMLYIRAVVNDMGKGSIHSIDKDLITYAISEGKSKDLKVKVNQRAITSYKSYSKCHALYLMPIFSATGGIYLCPENRGNEQLSLCNWITDDWREIWSSKRHNDIYNNFSLDKCISCRPDQHNVAIDNMLKSKNIEELFF
jgi:sulfatase maturation enzyme AslB (radical SAM superfamily)